MKFRNKITGEIRDCSPVLLNAAKLSAQNRRRLFWVGHLVNGKYERLIINQPKDKGIVLADILNLNVEKKENKIVMIKKENKVKVRKNYINN